MKKRIAKKQAKAFLEGRKTYPTIEDTFLYDTDGHYCIKTIAVMPELVRKYVYDYAERDGWDGCHWDAPDLVEICFPE